MFISLERLDMSGQLDWFLIPSQSAGLGVKSDLSADLAVVGPVVEIVEWSSRPDQVGIFPAWRRAR